MNHSSYPTFTNKGIETIFEEEFSAATAAQLLWKGNESFEKIFNAVKEAKLFICLQFYIFRNDDTGIQLSELLQQKRREGIHVYILYDHFGSFGTPRSFWRDIRKAGMPGEEKRSLSKRRTLKNTCGVSRPCQSL